MRFTGRTLRIFKNAEIEAKRTTNMVYPIHLVLGILLEKTGTFGSFCYNEVYKIIISKGYHSVD